MTILLDKDEWDKFIQYAKSETTDEEEQELKDALEFYNKMSSRESNKLKYHICV